MIRQYSSCTYCGSTVEERHVRVEMWFGDSMVIFEDVPAGVCNNCGEEYFGADIQDKMFSLHKKKPKKVIEVPVYTFSDPLTVAKAHAHRKKTSGDADRDSDPTHYATDEDIKGLMETDLEDWDE